MELLINLIIIGLLIPTIIYAYRLNKNLSLLRQNQNSLAKLIQSLNEATIKAEHSIPKLKTATESTSGELKEVVDNAKLLKDDLMFINERADNLADRLENVIPVLAVLFLKHLKSLYDTGRCLVRYANNQEFTAHALR